MLFLRWILKQAKAHVSLLSTERTSIGFGNNIFEIRTVKVTDLDPITDIVNVSRTSNEKRLSDFLNPILLTSFFPMELRLFRDIE